MVLHLAEIINNNGLNSEFSFDRQRRELINRDSFSSNIDTLDSHSKFQYLTALVLIIYFITRFNFTSNFIFGLAVAIGIIYYFMDKERTFNSEFQLEKEFQTKEINNIIYPHFERSKFGSSYVEKDPELVDLFYDVIEYASYNMPAYRGALKNTDSVLRLHNDIKIGIHRCSHAVDMGKMHMEEALNHFQSIIHSLPPSPNAYPKYHRAMRKLQLILRRYLDKMVGMCRDEIVNKKDITVNSDWILNDSPFPSDTKTPEYNNHYSYF